MANIRPFKAIRPIRDKSHLFASRSYITYSQSSLTDKLDNNPFTFLHIIHPDYNKKKLYGIEKYKLVKQKFEEFIQKGTLKSEEKNSFYIYHQSKNGICFTGIIAATSVNDYLDGTIKIHEHTITSREEMFKDYLKESKFNADPVLLSYSDSNTINSITKKYSDKRAEYEFTTTNKVCHKLWIINNKKDIKNIVDEFATIENIYIADGHHRTASSSLLCKDLREENPNYNPKDNFNYFMSYLIPESQLRILNFNRLIKTTNGLSENEFIEKIERFYSVTNKGTEIHPPIEKDEISMYLGGDWYSLIAYSKEYSSISESLDPSILSKNILSPILGITDEKTDKNISFYDGTIPLEELRNKIDSNEYSIAFILKPIDIESLKKVADNNEIMPPKSTYIQPKPRSGLTIYNLD